MIINLVLISIYQECFGGFQLIRSLSVYFYFQCLYTIFFFKGNINSFGYRKLCYFFIKLGTLSILTYLITSPFLYINNNYINIFYEIIRYSRSYIVGSINIPTPFKSLFWYQEVIPIYFFKWYFIFSIAIGFLAAYRNAKNSALLIALGSLPLTLHLLINVGWVGFWYLIPCLVPIISISCFLLDKKIKYYIYLNIFSLAIIFISYQIIY